MAEENSAATPSRLRSRLEGARSDALIQKASELRSHFSCYGHYISSAADGDKNALVRFLQMSQAPEITLGASAEVVEQQFKDLAAFALDMHLAGVYCSADSTLRGIISGGAEDAVEQFKAKLEYFQSQTPYDLSVLGDDGYPMYAWCTNKAIFLYIISQDAVKAKFAENARFLPAVIRNFNGDDDVVKAILEAGHPVTTEYEGNYYDTALTAAARCCARDTFKLVLSKAPEGSIDGMNPNGLTPLCIALSAQRLDLVEEILAQGGNIATRVGSGRFAYTYAFEGGITDFTRSVLDLEKVREQLKNEDILGGLTVIGFVPGAAALLKEKGLVSSSGNPIGDAVNNGRLDILQEYIAAGFPVNTVDSSGSTPLHNAAYRGESYVSALLEAGADPKAIDGSGNTPLISCIINSGYDQSGYQKLFELSDKNFQRSADGKTALHIALEATTENWIATHLLDNGAAAGVEDSTKRTPFQSALSSGSWALAERIAGLVEVDFNAVDPATNRTALDWWCASGSSITPFVEKIIASTDVQKVVPEGRVPYLQAIIRNRRDSEVLSAVKALLAKGANITQLHNAECIIKPLSDHYENHELVDFVFDAWRTAATAEGNVQTYLNSKPETEEFTTFTYYAYRGTDRTDGFNRILAKILELKPDINIRHPTSQATMLIVAAQRNNPGGVEMLLEAGADASLVDRDGASALDSCTVSLEWALKLKAAGAKLRTTGAPTFTSWGQDFLDAFAEDIAAVPLSVDMAISVMEGSLTSFRDKFIALLEEKKFSDLNVESTASAQTVLHKASYAGNYVDDTWYEWTKRLLAAGANPNLKRADAATPLYEAVRGTNRGAFELLLAHPDIDVNLKSTAGDTALMMAAERCNVEFLEKLLSKGADKNLVNDAGQKASDKTSDTTILELLNRDAAAAAVPTTADSTTPAPAPTAA